MCNEDVDEWIAESEYDFRKMGLIQKEYVAK
jgi:hypothetical protein